MPVFFALIIFNQPEVVLGRLYGFKPYLNQYDLRGLVQAVYFTAVKDKAPNTGPKPPPAPRLSGPLVQFTRLYHAPL